MANRPIVVGTDGSQESFLAVEWAAREAVLWNAPLRLISVPAMPPRKRAYEYRHHGDVFDPRVADRLRSQSKDALAVAVDRAAAAAPGLLAVDADLLDGPPARVLADSGSGAGMVVVGARGAGGFVSMILGSVSRYVAMHARCPVTVVRPQPPAASGEIVVGAGDTADSAGTLGFAFEEAATRGARLLVVHAWLLFPPAVVSDAMGRSAAAPFRADFLHGLSRAAHARLADTLAPWRDKYPEVRVDQDVLHGHPGRVLASLSARADLVVLGRHDGLPGQPAAIGSVAHAVLDHAHAPVTVVPACN